MQLGFQVYLTGSVEAAEFYKEAFGAELGYHVKNPDGSFMHAEIVKDGLTLLALSESPQWTASGQNMQFCLNFGKGNRDALTHAYEVLREGGEVRYPLGPCDWNEAIADLTDRYGVRWYIAL